MTTETKTAAATLRTIGLTINYTGSDDKERHASIRIDDDGDILVGEDSAVFQPTREAALAIAEAFTRLAQELPGAPTND